MLWLGNKHGAKRNKKHTELCRTTPASLAPKPRIEFLCEKAPQHRSEHKYMCILWRNKELKYKQKYELKLARRWRDASAGKLTEEK